MSARQSNNDRARPVWDATRCMGCGWCAIFCAEGALRTAAIPGGGASARAAENVGFSLLLDPARCSGCGVCAQLCPRSGALGMADDGVCGIPTALGTELSPAPLKPLPASQSVFPAQEIRQRFPDDVHAIYAKLISQLSGGTLPGEKWQIFDAADGSAAAYGKRLALYSEPDRGAAEALLSGANGAFTAMIALGADPAQAVDALREAVTFDGDCLVAAYAPKAGDGGIAAALEQMRSAVREGRWTLFPAAALLAAVSSGEEPVRAWDALNLSPISEAVPVPDAEARRHSFSESRLTYSEEQAVREALRCLRCREKTCAAMGCPIHNRIPEFLEKVAESDFSAAYAILSESSNLPAVCGRVCQQEKQCQGSCIRGNTGDPVSIGALERFVADWHRAHRAEEPSPRPVPPDAPRVAVVGSGPAGLSCAAVLADQGCAVTVFEREDVPGGVLRLGIPEFRLPDEVLEDTLLELKQKGVCFRTGVCVGETLTVERLFEDEGFKAVFLGVGAWQPNAMGIPGEKVKNVFPANAFLRGLNLGETEKLQLPGLLSGLRVLVVGGGNVAMDACRSAIRSNAEKVTVLYRRSEAEMPADRAELAEAAAEGVEFVYLTSPVEVMEKNGYAAGLRCVRMELGEPDESGRRSVRSLPGSEHEIPADIIITATGMRPETLLSDTIPALEVDRSGRIRTDAQGCTGVPGVYAGGDIVTGPATVVQAMAAGRRAAEQICRDIGMIS